MSLLFFRTRESPINLSVPGFLYARPLVQPLNEGPGASVEELGDPPRGHDVTVRRAIAALVYSERPSIVKFGARKPRRIIVEPLLTQIANLAFMTQPLSRLGWPNEKPLRRRVGM